MNFIKVTLLIISISFSLNSHANILANEDVIDPTETFELICTFAPSQSPSVNRLSGLVSGTALGSQMILLTNNLKYIKHSSGYPILTANGRYIANTLRPIAAGQFAVNAAIVVAGTAVVVELACVKTNHPELVEELKRNSSIYMKSTNTLLANATFKTKELSSSTLKKLSNTFYTYKVLTEDKFYELIGETWYQKAVRKTKEVFN